MTGFLATILGFNLTNDSRIARRTISGSKSGRVRTTLEMSCVCSLGVATSVVISNNLSVHHLEVLNNWPQGERREVRQRADNDDGSDQQNHKQRAVSRQGAARYGDQLFCREAAGNRQSRND